MLSYEHNAALSSVKTLILTHNISSFCLLSFLGWFSGALPHLLSQSCHGDRWFLNIFLYMYWMLPQLLFCLLFVIGRFSLQGMQLLFCLRVLLWRATAAACVLTARSGCYRPADCTHNSITSAPSSASRLTLFHSSLLLPNSASLFPSFYPSFLSLPHFPPLSISSSLLPHVFVSRASVRGADHASVSTLWAKDAAAKGGLGKGWGGVGSIKTRKTFLRSKNAWQIAEMCCVLMIFFFSFQKVKNKTSNKII